MLSLIGMIGVAFCILFAFVLEGGQLHVLFQPLELLIIGGSAFGGMVVSCNFFLFKQIFVKVINVLKGSQTNRALYIELVQLLFELIKMASANPLSLEAHIETPENSDVFKKYPLVLKNHHLLTFLCDTLKVQISATISPYDLEDLMDSDINTVHKDEAIVVATLNRVSDALPGLGIVAAVLGVVVTMGKLTEGKEVIGHSVAVALVGTFMGVLFCYGFLQPLTARVENMINEEGKAFFVIKAALLAYAKGTNAKICVEFARRTIPEEHRPTFTEVDEATSNTMKKAA